MKTVSFQGSRLTPGQRERLEHQRRIKSILNPVLVDQVSQIIAVLEVRKEQGIKHDRVWVLDYECKGTLCIAEWMGF